MTHFAPYELSAIRAEAGEEHAERCQKLRAELRTRYLGPIAADPKGFLQLMRELVDMRATGPTYTYRDPYTARDRTVRSDFGDVPAGQLVAMATADDSDCAAEDREVFEEGL